MRMVNDTSLEEEVLTIMGTRKIGILTYGNPNQRGDMETRIIINVIKRGISKEIARRGFKMKRRKNPKKMQMLLK